MAKNLASLAHPGARFHLFSLKLGRLDVDAIADQLGPRLSGVFAFYGSPPAADLRAAIAAAIDDHLKLRHDAAEFAADLAEEALPRGGPVALVVGREYVLTPGVYDSSVGRLLRDKRMTAIPSWVLDIDLDEGFGHLYWRNPHAIVTAPAGGRRRDLHKCVGTRVWPRSSAGSSSDPPAAAPGACRCRLSRAGRTASSRP